MREMEGRLSQTRAPFSGCKLSLQLNGVNVMTLEEGRIIHAVFSFVGKNGKTPKVRFKKRKKRV
jgi:hypothetical protein